MSDPQALADRLGRALQEAAKIIWGEFGDCPPEIDQALEAWRGAGDSPIPTVRDLIDRHTEQNRWVTLRAATEAVLSDMTCRNCGEPLGDDFYDTDQCEHGWGPQCHGCGSAAQ